MIQGVPYWRLSSLYFFYFAAVGVISPYWGVYLDHLGFSGADIGLIVATPMLTRMVAPNAWGWLADTSGRYLLVIRVGALLACATYIGVLFNKQFWGLLLYTTLFTFFWNAVLPQFEVITLDALRDKTHQYSRIRLWGSIGFIASVVGLGFLFDLLSVALLPSVLFAILSAIAIATFTIPATGVSKALTPGDGVWLTLRSPRVRYFLAAAFLLHVSHGAFYGFFTLFLMKHGYSSSVIGCIWAVGVVAEIFLFLKAPRLLRRFSLWHCYLFSVLAAVLRWVMVGAWVDSVWVVVSAQVLHAFTFGLAHSVAIETVRQTFDASSRGKGQALYSSVCFGGGGALGAYICGYLWMWEPAFCFYFAAIVAAGAACITYFGMQPFRSVRC